MYECKHVKMPIPMGESLIVEQYPKKHQEVEDIAHVPYASIFCSLMYVMVCTPPNITHIVQVLRRYILTPRKDHLKIVKRVFMYLCGTKDYDICYQGKPRNHSEIYVHGFVDID
jgi:hypothetical protein